MVGLPKTLSLKTLALIGNYLPRQCGIATFTADLTEALAAELDASADAVSAVAMNDRKEGYSYPPRVKRTIAANVENDYLRAAEFLNSAQYDAVILQHEFGIFGGDSGAHILHLVGNLRMPLITTLHTVLGEPSDAQMLIMQALEKHSEFLTVMSHKAEEILEDVYRVPREKIVFIPHGIPDVAFQSPEQYKEQFGFNGHKVILTFGLLGPSKGIEYVIRAMPEIVRENPDVIYVVLGATHPHVKKESGEGYRHQLQQMARKLGVGEQVWFCDQFVDLSTLVQYLGAADIYITPFPYEEQIVSGTLAYSLGAGNAVISTPYWYAQEMLAEGRGCLVAFDNSLSITREVNRLLASDSERELLRRRAYEFSRKMVWKEVARQYVRLIRDIPEKEKKVSVRAVPAIPVHKTLVERSVRELPVINLQHLQAFTDDTGMLQHATYCVPNRREGYCTDDNARALIVCAQYYALRNDETVVPAIQKYLAFLLDAFNETEGRFRNFMSYERRWLEDVGSEDSHGRAIWGLGAAIRFAPTTLVRTMALELLNNALPVVRDFSSPRAWALSILGLNNYFEYQEEDRGLREIFTELATKLYQAFERNASNDWLWGEDVVSYANATLSRALLLGGKVIKDQNMSDMGIASLKWLIERQTSPQGHISFLGNEKLLKRGGEKVQFDQQPIEAMALVQACAEAYYVTGDKNWLEEAERCFRWFLGYNDINQELYDFKTGACFDGIRPMGVNLNQGAESTLCFLLSLLTMYEIARKGMLKGSSEVV